MINLHAKNLRYQLIPSRHIDDQRVLQSGWLWAWQNGALAESWRTLVCTILGQTETNDWIKML